MARKSSLTLRLINPSKIPIIPATSPAAGMASQKLNPSFVVTTALVYAPIPKNAACPRQGCPAYPVIIFKLNASSTNMPTFIATTISYIKSFLLHIIYVLPLS